MDDNVNFDDAVKAFNVLGHPIRLKILLNLVEVGDKGLCPCDLIKNFDIKNSSLTFHLNNLEKAGLVRKEKKGQFIYYFARCCFIKSLGELLIEKCPSNSKCKI